MCLVILGRMAFQTPYALVKQGMAEGLCHFALWPQMVCMAEEAVFPLYLIVEINHSELFPYLAFRVAVDPGTGLGRDLLERRVTALAPEL